MLVGRAAECARLDGLLACARAGRGGALALSGEPGTGKSALLDYAVDRAAGATVLVARGLASESEIPFAGLLELVRPALDWLPGIPEPQARALSGALALGPPLAGDRFAAYAATLSLLARAADEAPVAVVDDAHWLDASSAEAVLFAAKRLRSERVGLLFALRETETAPFEAARVPILDVGGLDRDASLALRRERAPGIAASVAERLFAATAGNALALVETPALLSAAQLEGSEPLEDPPPAGAAVERAFLRRADSLPEQARVALLVAAVSGSPTVDVILGALAHLGLERDALERAENAGLLAVGSRLVEFRHPLVRSSVFHGAAPADRRRAHRALASAHAARRGAHAAERGAWHLAAAALGPDETVARSLEQAAGAARERTGFAGAASALERAAELTPKDEDAARRLLQAADGWQLAGRSRRAVELLDRAEAAAGNPYLRAAIHHLRGRIDTWGARRPPPATGCWRRRRASSMCRPNAPRTCSATRSPHAS